MFSMNLSSCPDVVIQFDPTGYMVAESGSIKLRIVKVGLAHVPISVSLSTVAGTAGQQVCKYTIVSICRPIVSVNLICNIFLLLV